MAGVVPVDIAFEASQLRSGYRDLRIASQCLLGAAGTRLRGHEFHFNHLLSGTESLQPAYTMHDGDGEPLGCEGWTEGNLLASFINLHFGQDPALARRFVEAARAHTRQRRALEHTVEVAGAPSTPV